MKPPPGAFAELKPDLIDAGKRASDTVNLHVTFGQWDEIKDKWIAFFLLDGSSDGTLYDSATDAITHQLHEQQCVYVCFRGLGPAGSKPYEMAKLIGFWRDAYAAGMRFVDPDNRLRAPLMTSAQNDYRQSLIERDTLIKFGKRIGMID